MLMFSLKTLDFFSKVCYNGKIVGSGEPQHIPKPFRLFYPRIRPYSHFLLTERKIAMNKYPVNPEAEEKSGHPILFILGLLAVVVVVGYALCGNPFEAITAENNAKQYAGITSNAEHIDAGSIDDPAGETFECELNFLDMDHHNLAALMINPNSYDHPITPDSDKFQADTEYIIQFNFPDMLRAEIENDNCRFDVAVKYEFEVQENHRFHVQVKLYNLDTGNLYVANGAILAVDDLCLKHNYGKGSHYLSSNIEFKEDCFEFSVYTSALPDAGPKVTASGSSGGWGYDLHYTIAGMTADEWEIPYE